jgi:hypothetical protein
LKFYRIALFSGVGLTATALAACGGGNHGSMPGTPNPVTSPVLVAGKVAHYTGTDTTTHVYQSPSPTQQNYTAGYTFAQTTTVNAAASGAPAPFDVNVVDTYTTTQAPTAGTQRTTSTTDDFENQTASGSSTTVTLVSSKAVATGTDVTAGNAGGGPYTTVGTTTTTYGTPRTLGVYPLVTGATLTQPQGRTVAVSTTDANAGGQAPSTTFVSSSAQTYANDGSFTRTNQISNGEQDVFTENANGSATESATGPVYALQATIGVPVPGTAGYTIPVSSTKQFATTGATPAPSATPASYNAIDWYPGAALPPSPLVSETQSVKGAASTLPSGCSGAIAEPNVVEVDDTLTSLDVNGSYETQTQQSFNSNGTNVCILRTTTTNSYDTNTGLPTQVTTETYAQILTSLTLPSSSIRSISPAT